MAFFEETSVTNIKNRYYLLKDGIMQPNFTLETYYGFTDSGQSNSFNYISRGGGTEAKIRFYSSVNITVTSDLGKVPHLVVLYERLDTGTTASNLKLFSINNKTIEHCISSYTDMSRYLTFADDVENTYKLPEEIAFSTTKKIRFCDIYIEF